MSSQRYGRQGTLAVLLIALSGIFPMSANASTKAGASAKADASATPGASVKRVGNRAAAPDVSLTDGNGRTVRVSDFKDKVLLLDFWATWCTGCKVEIPWFMEFQKKYEARGLASVGVAMDQEGWDKVRPYLAEHPISYPVVTGNLERLQKDFEVGGLPITLLIDRNGKIAKSHVGIVEKGAFERDIRRLLQEKPSLP